MFIRRQTLVAQREYNNDDFHFSVSSHPVPFPDYAPDLLGARVRPEMAVFVTQANWNMELLLVYGSCR